MKRFWTDVAVVELDGGYGIELDGRSLKTPARKDLVLPSETLAREISGEWEAVGEKIDPAAMPMTGLANAAIDRVELAKEAFASELAAFAETELCCYRAEHPDSLVAKQAAAWDPLLDWASNHYGIEFEKTAGIIHVAQPEATLTKLRDEVLGEDAFTLAGLSPLVRNGGSLIAALAVRHGAVEANKAWDAVEVDRLHQIEEWGEDAEAEKAAESRRGDFLAGARFLSLL
ncbi:ATP12 family chaperone protein [Sphingomicrobium sediminis]|uniref:ATPase n=1 Tax=Sphingomicrobium sediminis TaxID=2950949 RepID=A0A9X2EJ61_9SPHN|nr:ATP12 family protein [Sphingomicrobium sediminis]MCM8558470.1 ATPase [Sphingomicrobium sediminis]